jgi:hypothetical protein
MAEGSAASVSIGPLVAVKEQFGLVYLQHQQHQQRGASRRWEFCMSKVIFLIKKKRRKKERKKERKKRID